MRRKAWTKRTFVNTGQWLRDQAQRTNKRRVARLVGGIAGASLFICGIIALVYFIIPAVTDDLRVRKPCSNYLERESCDMVEGCAWYDCLVDHPAYGKPCNEEGLPAYDVVDGEKVERGICPPVFLVYTVTVEVTAMSGLLNPTDLPSATPTLTPWPTVTPTPTNTPIVIDRGNSIPWSFLPGGAWDSELLEKWVKANRPVLNNLLGLIGVESPEELELVEISTGKLPKRVRMLAVKPNGQIVNGDWLPKGTRVWYLVFEDTNGRQVRIAINPACANLVGVLPPGVTVTVVFTPVATSTPKPPSQTTQPPKPPEKTPHPTTTAPSPSSTPRPTDTSVAPSVTPRPTDTGVAPSVTPKPTNTVPPSVTPKPTDTLVPPTKTPEPTSTNVPPSATPRPTDTSVPPTEVPGTPTPKPTPTGGIPTTVP